MKERTDLLLVINGGSSSIKFSVYRADTELSLFMQGEIEGIGLARATFHYSKGRSGQSTDFSMQAPDYAAASKFLIHWLKENIIFPSVRAIGHRIVHGMQHTDAALITPGLLQEIKTFIQFDPEHLPGELTLIELFKEQYPKLPQIACFDTAFHARMPRVAKLLPIPRRFQAKGIRRYGFHGLSYEYLLSALKRIAGNTIASGKIIMAHLGSGASLAAIYNGISIDTSMGFTPASGLPMSTRTGDIEPGVATYLMQAEHLSPEAFNRLANHESGLAGLSQTSGDMRELMLLECTDTRAAEAIELFCYQTKKWIGSFAAVLEGLETLVFAGGIGEHAPEIRRRICNGLQFLGIEIDRSKNEENSTIISTPESKVRVYVIKTDEALMIARKVQDIFNFNQKN